MTWNIWTIKSRTLRAIVAWLFAALAAVVVLVALPFALVFILIGGAYQGVRGAVDGTAAAWRSYEWRELAGMWKRAATGKEAV